MATTSGHSLLNDKRDLEPSILVGAAKIIRTFIEDYHEKLEEAHRFLAAGR